MVKGTYAEQLVEGYTLKGHLEPHHLPNGVQRKTQTKLANCYSLHSLIIIQLCKIKNEKEELFYFF